MAQHEPRADVGRIVGVILAGGRSERMGEDKASLLVDGRPMVEWVYRAMRAAGLPTVVMAGGSPMVATSLDVELVPDDEAGLGPLAGIRAALRLADIVVVAPCDVPDVAAQDLGSLVEAIDSSGLDVACIMSARGREPLISAWRASCGGPIDEYLASGRRSVHGLLDLLGVCDVETSDERSLDNLNTPGDLAAHRDQRSSDQRGTTVVTDHEETCDDS